MGNIFYIIIYDKITYITYIIISDDSLNIYFIVKYRDYLINKEHKITFRV